MRSFDCRDSCPYVYGHSTSLSIYTASSKELIEITWPNISSKPGEPFWYRKVWIVPLNYGAVTLTYERKKLQFSNAVQRFRETRSKELECPSRTLLMSTDSENVKVCVRCRPMNEKEEQQKFFTVVKVDEETGAVHLRSPDESEDGPTKMFTFDYAFGMGSKQLDIFNKIARPIIEKVFEGYNGTIFAYGQTGTGKTFTMEGVRSVPSLRGIIPNSFAHIFGRIAKADSKTRFLVHVSYLEIYNEEVRDLLGKNQQTKLDVKERPDCGVYVKDLSTVMVHSPNEMEKVMCLGNKNRTYNSPPLD
ncbi:unnamed protein product [Schistocephalus solidus]|uniref:Kinesin motor domain-containing protein n=1 Tax=Schistocephalus solidus TaxID=70667 RepID=A0A183T0D7_SCHSO|nr:unnamed protein product [Schistocephalus solidus]